MQAEVEAVRRRESLEVELTMRQRDEATRAAIESARAEPDAQG
jgi:hypothetical protein